MAGLFMFMRNTILLSILVIWGLLGCNKTPHQPEEPSGTEPMTLLHDIWVITQMNGQDFPDNTSKQPQLEFKVQEKKFLGNDSCNQIFGELTKLNNTDLEFGMIAGTKMACPEMQVADEYRSLLGQTRHYEIKNLQLFLFDAEKELLLTFKKVD
jgi:heat shock protein HslJ